ncbi:MAG: MBL fold metallo-hydrolase [Candidatus Thiodiazotropha sp.]
MMKFLLIGGTLLGLLLITGWVYLQRPQFGPTIDVSDFTGRQGSPRFTDGQFHNLEPTELLAGDESTASVIAKGLFQKRPDNLRPAITIPSRKTDLKSLDIERDLVVWLGHSSWFVQLGGRRILIDPVFSRYAAPVPFANEAFEGALVYSVADMPDIDYLLITHDHWDHLDYPTIDALRGRVRHVVSGLGIDQYFLHWGYSGEQLHARDWFSAVTLDPVLTIHLLPARHYSSRLLTKNQTLWVAFALETSARKLFFGGDSGYGQHIRRIAGQFGNFDLAVLDMGQYDDRWRYIHMTPEQASQAAEELHAQALLPSHVGKFTIANHAWDEPFERIVTASKGKAYRLLTPMIGETVDLSNDDQHFAAWWRQMESRE